MLILYWTSGNIDHIATHGVTPDEAKEVVNGAIRPFAMNIGDGKWLVRGATSRGRHLQVIYVYRPLDTVDLDRLEPEDLLGIQDVEEVIFVIHARPLTEKERKNLRKMR